MASFAVPSVIGMPGRIYVLAPSAKAFASMSWRHYIAALNDPVSLLSLKNSLLLGVGGATLGILMIFISTTLVIIASLIGRRLTAVKS